MSLRCTRPLIVWNSGWTDERGAAPGLYHCVGDGYCRWLELGTEIARLLGVPARLTPVRTDQAKLVAERPRFCALENSRLNTLGLRMPSWQDALARHLRRYRAGALP